MIVLLAAGGALWYFNKDVAPDLAPFFPTPMNVVDRMLQIGKVTSTDVVYDLGAGDGRIVIQAAEKYGAQGVGVEYDVLVAQLAIDAVKKRKLEDNVKIVVGDATKVDVSPATVVMIYLLPETIVLLRPNLDQQLAEGVRVVTHNTPMAGWTPMSTEMMDDGTGRTHTLYLYEIGKQY
jgi:16S rRNA A1518/A1519 N6-dimethyltransferase RsmA/KsgA/DIM1 with predicted DNA glycosylase/AP lyase activity